VPSVLVRDARISDLEALLPLAADLGYPTDISTLGERLGILQASENHRILVAEIDSKILGVALLAKHISLFVEPQLEVHGLVVGEKHRGLGVGQRLMQEAERVCREWGFQKVRLSSNLKRTDAHRFYLSLGFAQLKTSHFFQKTMS
jgi:GNAT superfamily N-acetyltransferase